MKEVKGYERPTTRSRPKKQPEDLNKTKNSRQVKNSNEYSSDGTSSEDSSSDGEIIARPPRKGRVKFVDAPGKAPLRKELPYVDVPGLPYVPRKSRDTSQQNDLIPI